MTFQNPKIMLDEIEPFRRLEVPARGISRDSADYPCLLSKSVQSEQAVDSDCHSKYRYTFICSADVISRAEPNYVSNAIVGITWYCDIFTKIYFDSETKTVLLQKSGQWPYNLRVKYKMEPFHAL